MKVWRKVSVFLAMLVLCAGMINMPVSAASDTQDGLKVTLTTDKDTYSQSDEIKVNISVENTNSFDVNNVSLESVIPDGLELKKDYSSSATIGTLAAGDSYNCELVLQQREESVPVEDDENADSEDSGEGTSIIEDQSSQTSTSIDKNSVNQSKKTNESDSVQTGDYTSFVSVIVVLILSAIVIALLFLKRKNKIFLFLIGIVGSTIIIEGDVLNTKAAEEVKQKSIDVVETVSINNSEYELAVKVSYIFDDAINEYIPSKDAEIYISDNLYSDYAGDEHIKYDKDTGITYFDNELLVFFEDNLENAIAQLEDDISMTIVGKNIYDNSCLIRFDQAKEYGDLLQLCETLNEKDYVKSAYLNYSFEQEPEYYPNDTRWSNLWAETPGEANWGMEAIYAPEVWDFRSEMSSINVGVYDTGFDMTHPDLKNVTTTWIPGNESTHDIDHGTHVAGIIGADFDNEYGVAGVFPEANLVPFSCRINTSSDIDKLAYSYLIGERKCKVVNVSLGISDTLIFAASQGEFSAQEQIKASAAVLEESLSALYSDFIICTAAGNTSDNQFIKRNDADYGYYEITENEDTKEIGYYDNENNWHQYSGKTISASCDAVWSNNLTCISSDNLKNRIVVVGAAQLNEDSGYKLADFSNKGERVDVVAPGVEIESTISQSDFDKKNGTSMASPHVAGLAGILYSLNPYVNGEQVKSVIVETATTAVSNSDGKNMINAFNAYNRFKGLYSAIGKISGKVIDEQGNPIAGASVMMTDSSINGIPFGASTDENGEFIIDSETGTHSFEIKKEGFESYEGTAKVEANTTTIILEKIVLEKKVDVQSGIKGTVVDETGSAISDVNVEIKDSNSDEDITTTTDENGEFFVALENGEYKITFTKEGYESVTKDNIIVFNGTFTMKEIVLLEYQDETMFSGGDGSEENPYRISNAEQLDAIRKFPEANYILINNIDLSDWGNWTAIGESYEKAFTGNLNGNSYSISNLHYSGDIISKDTAIGLFGYFRNGCISNLNLTNVDININAKDSSEYYIGGIAGCQNGNTGTIENCTTSGNINIFGTNSDSRMAFISGIGGASDYNNCKNKIDITAESNFDEVFVGGIGTSLGDYNNCINEGDIKIVGTGKYDEINCGGISGNKAENISKCVNYGDLTAISTNRVEIGGITGDCYTFASIFKCVNYGSISGTINNASTYSTLPNLCVGGIIGVGYDMTVSYCYNSGTITANLETDSSCTIGGISGHHSTQYYESDINNSVSAGEINMYISDSKGEGSKGIINGKDRDYKDNYYLNDIAESDFLLNGATSIDQNDALELLNMILN